MTDVDDHNDLNDRSPSQNVTSVDDHRFSMSEAIGGLVEMAPDIQFLGVCQRISRLPESPLY